MEGITYKAGSDCGPAAGSILTGGRPIEINGNKVVQFTAPIIQGRKMAIKYDCRPDLAALVAEYLASETAEKSARQAKWAAETAKQAAENAPLIAAMNARADALQATIPTGSILVKCEKLGDLDGDPIYRYTAEGIEVAWQDVVILGRTDAVRPGALGAFAERCVAYITPAKLVEVRTRIETTRAQTTEKASRPQTTKTCQYCGTYCYGDCGGKPGDLTENDRAMRTAITEANYGIND